MTETRTVLLLGRTGNGKSTLANVISNTSHFAESEYGISETRGIQEGHFKVRKEDIIYHIVDTIGIGDTRFDENEVLNKLADAANAIRNGLNQILFVTSSRFTEEEVKAYNLLRTVFFAEDIGEYTTIVRTKFPSFRNSEKCKIDKEKMIAENEEIADIVRSCKKLIHVNNLTEEEDPELKSRKECRDILRTHLKFNCKNVYRPSNLDEINERIRKHMSEKDRIKKEMDNIKEKLKQAEERAKKGDEVAKKAQEEYTKTLKDLINQQSEKEGKIAKLMADQMNSKLSEIKEGYGKVISSLQSTIENLNTRLNEERDSYRTNYSKDLGEALKAQSKLINEENTKREKLYKAQIEELNKRKPEVHHHHHGICKIM